MLSFLGLNDVSVYNEPSELKPNNPFLKKPSDTNILDIAMEVLQTVTHRKSTSERLDYIKVDIEYIKNLN